MLICFFGEFLTGITGAMLAPFLLFYLYDVLGTGILPVMLVIGARPLTEVAVTLAAGGLTDRKTEGDPDGARLSDRLCRRFYDGRSHLAVRFFLCAERHRGSFVHPCAAGPDSGQHRKRASL